MALSAEQNKQTPASCTEQNNMWGNHKSEICVNENPQIMKHDRILEHMEIKRIYYYSQKWIYLFAF